MAAESSNGCAVLSSMISIFIWLLTGILSLSPRWNLVSRNAYCLFELNSPNSFLQLICAAQGNGAQVRYLSSGLVSREGFEVKGQTRTIQVFTEAQRLAGGDPKAHLLIPVAAKISLYHGYGYQTWFLPYKTRTFAMLGSYGQLIVMQPDTKIVIVMTSARKEQRSDLAQFKYDIAMIHGMLRSLGGNLEQYPLSK